MSFSKVCRTCHVTKHISLFYTFSHLNCRSCTMVQGSKCKANKKDRDRVVVLPDEMAVAYMAKSKEAKHESDTDDDSTPDSFVEDGRHLVRAALTKKPDRRVVSKRVDDNSTDSSSESSESSSSSGRSDTSGSGDGSGDSTNSLDDKDNYTIEEYLDAIAEMVLNQRKSMKKLKRRVKSLEDERLEIAISVLATK